MKAGGTAAGTNAMKNANSIQQLIGSAILAAAADQVDNIVNALPACTQVDAGGPTVDFGPVNVNDDKLEGSPCVCPPAF